MATSSEPGGQAPLPQLRIDLDRQILLFQGVDGERAEWPVSTAIKGPGEAQDSGRTPRGRHYVRAMVGHDQPQGTVFIARRPTGEVWSPELAARHPGRDWILSRIIWLCGREWGVNRGPGVDTFRRFIYIHGTPDTEPMGVPRSHGCIRMHNRDVIDLFARLRPGTPVVIVPET
ncbi:L,D-transpeptidase catalytic domain [Marinobacter daqiaonensis]|uniref:L,D-transpeptidase catalytic domain n=1 Tax=Marinobacter daqiaonensis TaxID=650891 RepID=A0A1I6H513_9GAMM|nr:L,D-transpeptidase [Marinobacter daqiaonensis]SFR49549.1 L,D-transpeptidase catalytic domain [Marinobacter daqiaonensis]